MTETTMTPEQLEEANRRDVLAYAYRDKDGKLYTLDASGDRTEAAMGARELSPQYSKVAEQTAAIIMMYNKVQALNPKERSMLSNLMNGGKEATSGVSSKVSELWGEIDKTRKESGIHLPGEQTFGAITTVGGALVDSVKAPFTILKDFISTGKNVMSQWGGAELTAQRALTVGTAYASAAQVASESHTGFKLTNTFDYLMAALKFATSWVCDKFGLDKGKEWGWHKDGDFKDFLAAEYRGGDNKRVAAEMAKFKEIGGLEEKDYSILTRGGVMLDKNGENVAINAADSKSAAPGYANGETPELNDVKTQQKGKNAMQRTADALGHSKFGGVAGLAMGVNPVGFMAAGAGLSLASKVAHKIKDNLIPSQGAVIGGLTGGPIGAVLGFFGGRMLSGKGSDEQEHKDTAKKPSKSDAAAQEGLHKAAIDATQRAQNAAVNQGKALVVNGATTVGAVVNHPNAAPINFTSKSNSVSGNHLA